MVTLSLGITPSLYSIKDGNIPVGVTPRLHSHINWPDCSGMVAAIESECWPDSRRNGGRFPAGIVAGFIRNTQPGEKVTDRGITFERLSRGDGRWSVNIMVDGSRIHRVIGLESEGVTLTQVQKFTEDTRTKAREGRLNLPKGRKITLSFNQAADDYLKRLRESDGKGIDFKDALLRLHLKPFFGNTPLSKLCQYDLERYNKLRQDEKAKPATINRELTVLLTLPH